MLINLWRSFEQRVQIPGLRSLSGASGLAFGSDPACGSADLIFAIASPLFFWPAGGSQTKGFRDPLLTCIKTPQTRAILHLCPVRVRPSNRAPKRTEASIECNNIPPNTGGGAYVVSGRS